MCLQFNDNSLINVKTNSNNLTKKTKTNRDSIKKRSKLSTSKPCRVEIGAVDNIHNAIITNSIIHSDNKELSLSHDKTFNYQPSLVQEKNSQGNVGQKNWANPVMMPQNLQKGYNLIISEWVSINKEAAPIMCIPSKMVKHLHKKRLNERGFRMTNKKLGEGGFGAVYKIYPKNDHSTPLACKIMLLSKENNSKKEKNSMLQAYSNEVFVMKSSLHDNIVCIKENFICSHGSSTDNVLMSHSYIVMEYAAMGTLYAKLKKHGPFNELQSGNFFVQIANALLHLHEKGIAHRDLKLGNILLTTSEKCQEIVKLTDFGLSRLVNSEESGLIRFSKPAGTLSYMSPQIISCYILYNTGKKSSIRPYDPFKSDIWALGICLFLLLSKIHPFESPPSDKSERVMFAKKMLDKQVKKDWQIPTIIKQCTSNQCKSILEKLLEPNNRKRPNIYDVLQSEWVNLKQTNTTTTTNTQSECSK